jgi:hypothetical protein
MGVPLPKQDSLKENHTLEWTQPRMKYTKEIDMYTYQWSHRAISTSAAQPSIQRRDLVVSNAVLTV